MAQVKDGSTTQVSCRVPVGVAEALQKMADEQERSLSWIASRILRAYILELNAKVTPK